MIRVRFVRNGAEGVVEAPAGARLLDVAQDCGQPLEGTCDGQMACATCHVVVAAEDAAKLPPPSEEEEDLLDMVPNAARTSRLACQIVLDDSWGALTVRV